ncbi:MAG: hypothetical protein WD000_05010 [Thermodesulfobacteriota bacterium]
MEWKIYDYIDARGKNDIKEWTASFLKKQKRLVGTLNQKILMLEQTGQLPPKSLTDTRVTHISEIVINEDMALRLLLCKGPTPDANKQHQYKKEFTLLFGAIEKDVDYVPKDAPERASMRRKEVIKNPNKKRCSHETVVPKIKKRVSR